MTAPLRVLVTGTRAANWPAEQVVTRALDDAREVAGAVGRTILDVHGARGVDTIAGFWAFAAGDEHERHPAEWERLGKVAGHGRGLCRCRFLGFHGAGCAFATGGAVTTFAAGAASLLP